MRTSCLKKIKPKRTLSQYDIDDITAAYRDALYRDEQIDILSQMYMVDRQEILNILDRYEMRKRYPCVRNFSKSSRGAKDQWTDEMYMKLADMMKSGIKKSEIVTYFGFDPRTVERKIRRLQEVGAL